MTTLPQGTVTFAFTDIEGSTALLKQLGERYVDVLSDHRRLVRESFTAHGGTEIDSQGDAFFFAFARASSAVAGAVQAELAHAEHAWPDGAAVRVRIGLHTGEPLLTAEGFYVGMDVHRAARLMAAAHGGQVVVSQSTAALLHPSGSEPQALVLRDLGEHPFKDLAALQRVFQLGDQEFPPIRSLHRSNLQVSRPHRGRVDAAERYCGLSADAAADDDLSSQCLWRGARAKLLAQAGDFDGAHRHALEAVRLMQPTGLLSTKADRLTDLATVLVLAERRSEASDALRETLMLYERKGNLAAAASTRVALATLGDTTWAPGLRLPPATASCSPSRPPTRP